MEEEEDEASSQEEEEDASTCPLSIAFVPFSPCGFPYYGFEVVILLYY